MVPFIQVNNVTKCFANHVALNNISLNVEKQSIYGLLGPNGAGKTTLIRILNQITAPDSGTISIDGEPLSPKHISHIGYLPEERGLYKKMKVSEQAIYLAQLKGVEKNVARKRLIEWFEKFEITNWWDKKVEELSKGMQQKIQFITTIIHQPQILIFDEPFSGFDPINANLLKSEILDLRNQGTTILFSTHNMASVEELCDHITLINNGKNILQGRVYDIKNEFKTNTYEAIIRTNKPTITLANGLTLTNFSSPSEGVLMIKLKANEQQTPNSLIHSLSNEGEIISFNEVLPTMNEIFIQKVTNDKKDEQ